MDQIEAQRRIVVIGGGISGLAAAHRLGELDPALDLTLLEASPRLGGILETVRRDGYLIERSADNFITKLPWAIDLCRRIGMQDDLLPTDESRRRAFVVCRGKLQPVPEGFLLMQPKRCLPLLTSPILSPLGKLRLLSEYFIPRRGTSGDESLAMFARRRLGSEAFERLVQPLIGGIYTADPEKLSMAATMPQMLEMESKFGSLIRAARHEAKTDRQDSGARYSMFLAPREGISSLIDAIARRLPEGAVRLQQRVEHLQRSAEGGWRLTLQDGAETIDCQGLIVALPAFVAGPLLNNIDSELAGDLSKIEHAGAAVVVLGYRRDQIQHPLNGFGFVVPSIERRRILSASFSSVKFPGRAPEGCELIRVFLGGALQPELAELEDQQLQDVAIQELGELMGIRGEPHLVEIVRWLGTMPQYHLGHLDLVAQIESRVAALPGLELAGNAYRGVGIPQCIHSGEQAAQRLLESLSSC